MKSDDIKSFYSNYSDRIINKRFRSKFELRRYVHAKQYESVLNFVEKGMKVLDAGCGEGVLSIMMAEKGADVIGCDLSELNIQNCFSYAKENRFDNIKFVVGDAEKLPFDDDSFDLVVSSHVLEHLPDFNQGLREVMRVTKKRAIVAIPTILNLCSIVQVGGGMFWIKRPKSFLKIFWGFLKTIYAFLFLKEGVDEGYGGYDVPHVFRFPWVMKRKIKQENYDLVKYEASSICLPYFEFLLPLIKFLDKYKSKYFFRNLGYGTTFVIEKINKK